MEVCAALKKRAAYKGKSFAITTRTDTPISKLASETIVLNCEKEQAVAATESVVVQALAVQAIVAKLLKDKSFYKASHFSPRILMRR